MTYDILGVLIQKAKYTQKPQYKENCGFHP